LGEIAFQSGFRADFGRISVEFVRDGWLADLVSPEVADRVEADQRGAALDPRRHPHSVSELAVATHWLSVCQFLR